MVRADLGINRVYTAEHGLLVLSVAEGGAAERAGIRPIQLKVEQLGPACHTGRPNCFYNAIRDAQVSVISVPQ